MPPPAPVEQFDSSSLAPFLGPETTPGDPDRVALFLANPGWPGGRRRSLKLIWAPESGARVLFDLDDDPGESVDVSGDPAYGAEHAELDCAVRNRDGAGAAAATRIEAPEGLRGYSVPLSVGPTQHLRTSGRVCARRH